jgi:hypothetical protein
MHGRYCMPKILKERALIKGKMEMFTAPEYFLDYMSLDIVGLIPSFQGKKSWVAVKIDCLSHHIRTCMFLRHPSSISLFEFIEVEIIRNF